MGDLRKEHQRRMARSQRKFERAQKEQQQKVQNERFYGLARICHYANRAIIQCFTGEVVCRWEELDKGVQQSVIDECAMHLNAAGDPSEFHDKWVIAMKEQGWTYGLNENPEAKTHPDLVEFRHLPKEKQVKDYVTRAIVDSLKVRQ